MGSSEDNVNYRRHWHGLGKDSKEGSRYADGKRATGCVRGIDTHHFIGSPKGKGVCQKPTLHEHFLVSVSLLCIRESEILFLVQGSAKRQAPVVVNFVPALAYHFYLQHSRNLGPAF